MSKQAFDKKLEALDALRTAPDSSETVAALRKALSDRNNYAVSKAAAIASQRQLQTLIPDLLAAFDRFLQEPAKADPQCWAKNAIAKALVDLGYTDAEVFLKGLSHFQMEPVWGGQSDTAATLRGTCALALVNCRMDDISTLEQLVPALADPEKVVRQDGARAVAQLGSREGALLLRLKALCGDKEPEVIGQCFASLLSLEPANAVDFIARFVDGSNRDIQLEAACALAQSDQAAALATIRDRWEHWTEPEFKRAVVLSLGASPLPEAAQFLLSIIEGGPVALAADAVGALAASRFRDGVRQDLRRIVDSRNAPILAGVLHRAFGAR